MKPYFTFLIIITLITAESCESFLDTDPVENIAFKIIDESSANAAILGAYNKLSASGYYGLSFQALGYLSGDAVKWTGSLNYYSDFNTHAINADNTLLSTVWNAIYSTINLVNVIIYEIPSVQDVNFTDGEKNQILGEAYFIRALSYFDLARVWGGVQLTLDPTNSPTDGSGTTRSTLSETYDQVLQDLNQAESLLPDKVDRNRAVLKSAFALKARYYLYQGDWVNAEIYASRVIDDTNYDLVKPFSSYFTNKGSNESILELAYNTSNPSNHYYSWLRSTSGSYGGGRREWAPSDTIVKLLIDDSIGGTRDALIDYKSGSLVVGVEYWRSSGLDDPAYLLRISEQYLIRAEARARQANLEGALADLNQVRNRAEVQNSQASNIEEVLFDIERERLVEFPFEPHRWFDLIRTERADDILGIIDRNKWVLPIPYAAIQADKPYLEQNQGY